jgi:hypothetical protein
VVAATPTAFRGLLDVLTAARGGELLATKTSTLHAEAR